MECQYLLFLFVPLFKHDRLNDVFNLQCSNRIYSAGLFSLFLIEALFLASSWNPKVYMGIVQKYGRRRNLRKSKKLTTRFYNIFKWANKTNDGNLLLGGSCREPVNNKVSSLPFTTLGVPLDNGNLMINDDY